LRASGVGCIVLVHGTFSGGDTTGFCGALGRLSPALGERCERWTKRAVDAVLKETGNYLPSYADTLREAINHGHDGPEIPVRLFMWTSENHHLGRAHAAVRLLDELSQLSLPPGKRILVWGHSHGGNILALLTHLLADEPDGECTKAFFQAARTYYRSPWSGRVDLPVWGRVEKWLASVPRPLPSAPLDLVTFGTPIRYGWNPAGCAKLLHFVHHRHDNAIPAQSGNFFRAAWQRLNTDEGDFVQYIGIAGTNFMPLPLFYRAWLADRRLARLLQPEYSPLDLFTRLRYGRQISDVGQTLLVDYGPRIDSPLRHAFGHACYTQRRWLPFHAAETARHLYTESP